jgi:hypothetical protein
MSLGRTGIRLAWDESMKSVSECYRGAALVAFCLLGACRVVSADGAATAGDEGGSGAGSSAAAGSEARGGGTAAGGKHAGGASGAGAPSVDSGAAGQAGASDEAGASGAIDSSDGGARPQSAMPDPATAECDADGGCVTKCSSESATCAVESAPGNCEFELFHDIPTTVSCGQTATVGIANCGACGSVAVEVYFDGSYCWQGFPDCMGDAFGKFIEPHAPLP